MKTKTDRPLRILYMGTPHFAVSALCALADKEEVALVVTQPDRPAGRGRKLTACPVKGEALKRGLPILQPESIKEKDVIHSLRDVSCDLAVVAAFGQILPKEVLELPPLGCINIHASLLPKYRGPSPVNTAILRGEKETGITTMFMDEGMDTGDILLQRRLEIFDDESAGDLSERLSRLGAEVLMETLTAMKQERLVRTRQNNSEATYAPKLTKKQGEIDWNKEPDEIRNLVRAMDPWPGAYTTFHHDLLKIWNVTPCEQRGRPGEVLSAKDQLVVGAKGGAVTVIELQLPGKKKIPSAEFLRGNHTFQEGMILG